MFWAKASLNGRLGDHLIDQPRAELLHEIKRQAGSVLLVGVEQPERRVETGGVKRGHALAKQDGVQVRQGGVRHVLGWLAGALRESHQLGHELAEAGEVELGGGALQPHQFHRRIRVGHHTYQRLDLTDRVRDAFMTRTPIQPLQQDLLLGDLRHDDRSAKQGSLRPIAGGQLRPNSCGSIALCMTEHGAEVVALAGGEDDVHIVGQHP